MDKTTRQIELIFSDSAGKNFTVRVNDPDPYLTPAAIKDRMTEILNANVFRSQYGPLVAVLGARIVERTVTEYEILND